jgi:hypothetical protein
LSEKPAVLYQKVFHQSRTNKCQTWLLFFIFAFP